MNMKKIYILIIVLCFSIDTSAQEINLPQYLNYMGDNPFAITPAYVGIGSGLRLRLNGLSQWVGIKNAPQTQSLSIENRIGERFGGGLTVFKDANGNTSQQGVKLTFASHLILSEINESFLSFGLTYSYIQFNIDASSFDDLDVGLSNNFNFGTSNFGVSFLYRFNNYSVSVNAINLLDKDDRFFSTGEPLKLRRYSFFNSYVFSRFYGDFEIEPSVLVEYFESDKRSRTDINLKIRKKTANGYLWAGISYNFLNDQLLTPNTIAPLVGLKRDNFYASYGFGINTNRTQNFNAGSHMITVGYDFMKRESLARCTKKYYMFQ